MLSPLDNPGELIISHNEHAVDLIDNGHTIQITYDEGSTIVVDGITFELAQFHFHTPSEHVIDGRHYPMEIHLVHQSGDGELAVLGVLVEEGQSHTALQALIDDMPSRPGESSHFEHVEIDVDALLPLEEQVFRYRGSLTTPPCSEGVRWGVMTDPIGASSAQIDAFTSVLHRNNRPVQPLGDRQVGLMIR